MTAGLPTIEDVKAARERVAPLALHTPLLRVPVFDKLTGAALYLKAENLQRTGSFKIRGATNFLQQLSVEERRKGVVAYSSGNHAQGVAEAARHFGIPATIVAPEDAPPEKLAGVRQRGARLVTYDRARQSREEIGARLALQHGLTVVPPFDHAWTIAGQGTVGLEIVDDAAREGVVFDDAYCCAGGGGLISGLSIALHATMPDCAIHAVEPVGFDDINRSLRRGAIQKNDQLTGSVCDALLAPAPGEMTFAMMRDHVAGGLTVTDGEALAAMASAFRHARLVLEPGGAVALAAALMGKRDIAGKKVLVILSGGNVDTRLFAKVISPMAITA